MEIFINMCYFKNKNTMCGILLVKTKDNIDLNKHLDAFNVLKSRGPDFSRYRYQDNIFIGQTVLHITGDKSYYNQEHKNFLAYNGEIYNISEFGYYNNDIEFVHNSIETNLSNLKNSWGTWAFAYNTDNTVFYASDPQGEKCLYRYVDDTTLIVCSEISPILKYIKNIKIHIPYNNKTWNINELTPWKGVTRIKPGILYKDNEEHQIIDSVFDWKNSTQHTNFEEAYDDFRNIWNYVISHIRPKLSASLSYSGGLDSNLILNSIPNLNLCAVNIVGKDNIVENLNKFLTETENTKLSTHHIGTKEWASESKKLMHRIKLPLQTWSHVGKWIVSKTCKDRILFTGTGADELFGGYEVYKNIKYDVSKSYSPYSENTEYELWNKCLSVYDGNPKQATLLIDYLTQVVGCDSLGMDSISGAWGIEVRNPFLAKPIIQFAMNLPFEFKVNTHSKPLIRKLFLERWTEDLIYPKMGFAGHANDSFPEYISTGNRLDDWKKISYDIFYN